MISTPVVQLLRADPDLAEQMPPDMRRQATDLIRVRVFRVQTGQWEPVRMPPGSIGLLLLEGLMVRTLHLGRVSSSEVVGPGDIIRPWERDLLPDVVPAPSDWRVLEEAHVVALDRRATMLIGRWPELTEAIGARLLRRTRSLAFLMAAQHFIRVEDRLLATLWHLAAMWGRVTPLGTVVPFRLTHEMLAGIIGAQRPTTTTAIRSLQQRGKLDRDAARRYVLLGDPPEWGGEQQQVTALEV